LIQPALLGGLFIGILSALPVINLANCCCIWTIGGGVLAAYLDQAPGQQRGPGRGALDGMLAGIVGAFVFLVAAAMVNTVMAPLQERMIDAVINGAYDLPPEAREWFEMARDRDAGAFGLVLGFFFQLFTGIVFGALGGLLGATFFWKNNVPPALGGPQMPPPPPPLPPQY
jgi:hypothetical protein